MFAKVLFGKKIYLTDIVIVTRAEDSANIASQLSGQDVNERTKSMILGSLNPNGIHKFIVKEYNSPECFSFVNINKKPLFYSDSAFFSWKLVNETKKIDSFICQKAVGKYGKDSVEAWFTEQIPLNAGPSIINGLPGLILEYYNPSTKTYYQAVTITNLIPEKNKFKEFSNSQIIDKSEYEKLLIEDHKNAEKLRTMIENGKVDNSQ
jgi:GLPGLI family protein